MPSEAQLKGEDTPLLLLTVKYQITKKAVPLEPLNAWTIKFKEDAENRYLHLKKNKGTEKFSD